MKAKLTVVDDHGITYTALAFVCPGCAEMHRNSGLHILPVNSPQKSPNWIWNGSLEAPTITPSILTGRGEANTRGQCHSFLTDGVFEFLSDSTHSMAGQRVPLPDLPDWFVKEDRDG